ncbi:7594_t:CDS:1 [Funneliformis mosseae]|uniref:7594_t:CDS:1 n=1 Tax=Funneliformis mosseae TaxID=27381 RepID=A0A9N8Z1D1_FUNMO|nr:7594_t:CDS:1 [Funneliformis mosseae]
MTETETPTNPVTNGTKDFATSDFEKFHARINAAIEKNMESPILGPKTPNTGPIPSMMLETKFDEIGSLNNGTSTPADSAIVAYENGGSESEDNSEECHCQSLTITPETATCSKCERVIPILANLHKQNLQQRDDLEIANNKIKEEFDKVESQHDEIEQLRKMIEKLEDQIDEKTDEYNAMTDEFNALKKDMAILNEKYVDEIDKVAELQHSKDMVEGELEELSRVLFEQANGMVASAARERYDLEVQQKALEKQLKETQERLMAESSQLNELREKMEQLVQNQPQSESRRSSSSDPSFRASIDFAELFGLREKSPDAAATLPAPTGVDGIGIDNELIIEFQEFVEQSPSVKLQKIHTIPFMRHILEEDVDPCMRFGSNPRVSSRRIVDAIVANTCCIEESPPGAEKELALHTNFPVRNSASKPMLWERLAGNATFPRTGCQCCGRVGPLPFMYRITNLDDWSLIDRYCRDRMVAVCEFYVFIRNIRQGLCNHRPIVDLYAECLRLRLQMFYARLGALPSMLNTLGIKSTELASAKKPSRTPSEVGENISSHNDEELEITMVEEQEFTLKVSAPPPPRESSLLNLTTPPDTPAEYTKNDLNGTEPEHTG